MKKIETYQDLEPGYHLRGDVKEEYLQSWVFHFNPYKEIWYAIPRDKYMDFWQGGDVEGVQKSQSLSTLLMLMHKTNGDIDKMNKIGE
jgi:hypothetical protein